jgi:hypothetical protein
MILSSVEDEHTFFISSFMKFKFCNYLITNLDIVVCMHVDFFNGMDSFSFYIAIQEWAKAKL